MSAWVVRLVVLVPLLAGVVGATLPRASRRVTGLVATGGALVTLGFAVAELTGPPLTSVGLLGDVPTGGGSVSLDLRADRLSALVAVMVALVATCVQLFSTAYQSHDRRYRAYAATVSLFTGAMLLVVQADDLLLLLVGWEVMGLCSYLLVGHDSERPAARRAAVKAFVTTRVGDVGFVLGIVVLLVQARTTSISVLLSPQVLSTISTPAATAAVLLLVAGVVGKSAQFPLQSWLPDAMEGPTPVSALIHAATMVAAGGYVIARLLPLLALAPAARGVLAVLTAVSMVGAALIALAQDDLKRVLAWSTISQVAYLLAALAVVTPGQGPAAGLTQLLSHAGFKALLFLSAGALAHQVHTTAMSELAGAWRRAPLVAVTFTVGLASLGGLPPLSGFWSKEAVLGAAEQTAHGGGSLAWAGWLVLVAGLLTGLLTAGYATRAFLLVVPVRPAVAAPAPLVADAGAEPLVDHAPVSADGGAERGADGDLRPPDVPPAPDAVLAPVAPVGAAMTVPLLVLAVPALAGGLLLLGPVAPGEVHLSLATGLLAASLAVAGVLVAVLLGRRVGDPASILPARLRSALAGGLGADAVTDRIVVRPVRGLARAVAFGDREVVDAYPRAAATSSRWAGALLRRTQTGVATGYLTWLVAGAVVVAVAGVGLR